MLHENEFFYLDKFECQIRSNTENPKRYWILWSRGYTRAIRELFGTNNLSLYTAEYLKRGVDIKYSLLSCPDSPDFPDLENINKYIQLLKTHIISRKLKILK